MSNLFKCRWFTLRHNRILWMTCLICFVFAIVIIGPHYLTDAQMVAGASNNFQGLFMASTADCIFPLLIISGTFTVMILGRQFSDRTVGQEIAAGHSRMEIFLSECLVGFILPGATSLLAILLGCIRWVGCMPLSPILTAVPYFVRTILLLLILSFSLFSPCILFLMLFRDAVKAMAASAFFLFFLCFIMAASLGSSAIVPGTAYTVAPTLPLLLNPDFLMRYVLYSTLTPAQGLWAVCVAVVWMALFLSMAYGIFRRCELK